jgi:hypothetical protein
MRRALSSFPTRTSTGQNLVLAFLMAAVALACACGGNSNFTNPTSTNPAPGVTLQKITITPTSSIILLAETRQLFAEGTYSDGSTQDISSLVKWSASSANSTTNYVSVTSGGVATASGIGASSISATLGPVTGLLTLTVGTNGFSSSTLAILSVPHGNSQIDVAYLPQQTQINGGYAVQEVDLDADQFSSFLPVPDALVASIAMPAGFVPNAAAPSQTSSVVAVISYSSPNIQIIDASNNPLDVNSNTLTATYKAPISQSVTINGTTCMICAAVVNPSNNQLLLSTAQGFYSMSLSNGAFTQIPFSPPPAPSANISLDPVATPDPFILSTVAAAGEIQILDLTTNAVTTYSNIGVAPTAGFIDLLTQYSGIVDGTTNDETLVDFTQSQNPVISPVPGVTLCSASPAYMNMASLGVTATAVAQNVNHYLLTGQTGGSCLGFEAFPGLGVGLSTQNILYGYGAIPTAPDGTTFVGSSDPNAIATFTSVFDKNIYGVLLDGNQQWLAKINLGTLNNSGNLSFPGAALPTGADISPYLLAGSAGDAVIFLPTPSTQITLSASTAAPLNFGSVTVGTSSPQTTVTVANISESVVSQQVAVQGTNAADFSTISSCQVALQPLTNCSVAITFTPSVQGAESAALTVTAPGSPTQTVQLSGTGQ